jgi:quinol monooxygenase YgiN
MKKLYCIAKFKAKDCRKQELIDKLTALKEPTHRESGCIGYEVTIPMINEYAPHTDKFFDVIMNEEWENKIAFELHCDKQYIQKFFNEECLCSDGCVDSFLVTAYENI